MANIVSFIKDASSLLGNVIVRLGSNQGYIPGGVNGPYFDIESPVRNSAHALIIFSFLYKQTNKKEYKDKAQSLANFLLEPSSFCANHVFIHRQKKGKDWCNGVIGQAWVIEALNNAGQFLTDDKLKLRATELAEVFPFDNHAKAWKALDPSSAKYKVDYTLNHQLWYAAAIAETGNSERLAEVEAFLTHLNDCGFRTRPNGLIIHQLYSATLKSRALRARYALSFKRSPKIVLSKEIGYHLYNLLPLARLFKLFPAHPLFSSKKFQLSLTYCGSNEFLTALVDNKYAYPYNSPTFEFPMVIKSFGEHFSGEQVNQIEEQIWSSANLFGEDDKGGVVLEEGRIPDAITLLSRTYELVFSL